MSGGSYNYLYLKSAGDFLTGQANFEIIDSMKDRLCDLEFEFLAKPIEAISEKLSSLRSIYYDLENETMSLSTEWRSVEDKCYKDVAYRLNLDDIIFDLFVPDFLENTKQELEIKGYSQISSLTSDYQKKLESFLSEVKLIQTEISKFSDIWHSVEWHQSNDSGIDSVIGSVNEYKEKYI